MSESKIGKWLTNDGLTAVILAVDNDGRLHGVNRYPDGNWEGRSWNSDGIYCSQSTHSRTLRRKVSDSTDLTPYVSVKRVRPWTRAEVEAIVQQRPLWVRKIGGDSVPVNGITDSGINVGFKFILFGDVADNYIQLDGSPCGVEVEE